MFLGYRMKKRSMPAYDKVVVPELEGCRSISPEQPLAVSTAKRRVRNALRAAASIVLAFTLIGLVVSNNVTGDKNSFTLVAYAASASGTPSNENNYTLGLKSYIMSAGVTMRKNTVSTLPVMKVYLAKDAEGNNYGSNIDDFSLFERANILEDSKHVDYTSGFQFSGDNIDSVTMTSQEGKFHAYDLAVLNPICEKYRKTVVKENGVMVGVVDDKQFSEADKAIVDAHIKSGQTITFPPAGYTAYWGYTIDTDEKTSDTINITVKFTDGSIQVSILSISENEYGVIIAEMK